MEIRKEEFGLKQQECGKNKKFRFEEYLPVGYDAHYEIRCFLIGMLISVLWGSLYFRRLYNDWYHLWKMEWINGELVRTTLQEGAVMRSFEELFFRPNSLAGFFIVGCMMFGFMAGHYVYHYQFSKSIYVMKRLPDKWEFYRRCFVLPLIGLMLSLLAAGAFYGISEFVYYYVTPLECIVGWCVDVLSRV